MASKEAALEAAKGKGLDDAEIADIIKSFGNSDAIVYFNNLKKSAEAGATLNKSLHSKTEEGLRAPHASILSWVVARTTGERRSRRSAASRVTEDIAARNLDK